MKKESFGFKILCDTEKALAKAYGAQNGDLPYPARKTFLVSPEGKIEKVFDKVTDLKKHAQEVLDAIPSE